MEHFNSCTSISATLHVCDLVAHLTDFNGRTADSRTFEKMTVKSATKLHYIDNINLYSLYRSFFLYFCI